MSRLLLGVVVALVAGCSGYYNGMYTADRLASRARRAEREGRTFDATSLWGQVTVRAESALVRHPRSGWADRARLLQGTALAKLKDCSRALPLLEAVMVGARETELAEQAALLVGSCRVAVGDPIGATSAYARLTNSRDAGRRNLALLQHGRALRMAGSYDEALAELAGSEDPRARGERAATLAALGRVLEAEALADSLMLQGDSAAPYDSLHAGLARHDSAAATHFVDRLSAATALPAAVRTAVLLQDARRLIDTDSAAGDRRLAEAQTVGRGTALAAEAKLQAAAARIARADRAESLVNEADHLEDFGEAPGVIGTSAQQLAAVARRVVLVADSTPSGTPSGDLRLFIAAELARDSLGAPRFAALQFQRIISEWPGSEYAPKALLALIELEPALGDSLLGVIRARYADSPYVLFASGEAAPDYEVLEDSLRRFTETFRPEGRRPAPRPGQPGARPAQPVTPRAPSEPQ
ncbi:MAG: hypothetical protein ABI742_08355 [Gemmatimonadota bacterium]